jgi:hypothetical protein
LPPVGLLELALDPEVLVEAVPGHVCARHYDRGGVGLLSHRTNSGGSVIARGTAPVRLVQAEHCEETLFFVCAWCRRVRGPERSWLPLDRFVPPDGRINISHGMCRPCHAKTLREAAG